MLKEIKPTYVSFNTAKWLKEKGFDLVTRTAYDYKIYQPSNLFHENIEVINNAKNYSNSEYERFQRPEQWEVNEWLTVKYGIWISVYLNPKYKKFDYEITNINWGEEEQNENLKKRVDKILNDLFNTPDYFNTPQEAYNAAFDYIRENNLI